MLGALIKAVGSIDKEIMRKTMEDTIPKYKEGSEGAFKMGYGLLGV